MDLVLILLLHVSAVDCIEGAYITLASLSHKNKRNKMYVCMYVCTQDKTTQPASAPTSAYTYVQSSEV